MEQTTPLIDREARYTSRVYRKRDLAIVRGEGAYLWDELGRKYIDCTAGIGVANIGHSHPRLVMAMTQQAATLITCPELFYNDQRAVYQERLVSILPEGLERIYLCNSGTEAIEATIKFARLSTGRPGVVSAMRGFHGRTFGALSATYKKIYRQPFEPLVPGFKHIPFNNIEQLTAILTDEIAVLILEIVQGEGGVRPGSAKYFQQARRLCNERGILLAIDEVQTGFGRTGRWFACEHIGIVPDMLVMGKGMAGGFPMGAVALGSRVAIMPTGLHGSTFGGNPLACAAALSTIEVLDSENLIDHSAFLGAYTLERLKSIDSPLIREVRGLGLMIGIEIRTQVHTLIQALTEKGVLALKAGSTVLRLLPPLVIKPADIDFVVEAINESLTALDKAEGA